MTTLAWDGHTLAADKLCDDNGIKRTTTKIWKIKDCLLGVTGSAVNGKSLLNWYCDGKDPDTFPYCKDKEAISILIEITKDGKINQYWDSPYPIVYEDTKAAFGSGRDFATAVMDLGFGAINAVETACKFDVSSGMGVDFLTLNGA